MKAYMILGPAGSGKGTQRKLLEDFMSKSSETFLSVIAGDLLREKFNNPDTPYKERVADVMLKGGLVPSGVTVAEWVNKMTSQKLDFDNIIFDGCGRKLIEARMLLELIEFFPNVEINVIFINIPDEVAIERLLSRKREDDTLESIKKRLSLFRDDVEHTTASLNFLKERDNVSFYEIDGEGSVEEIHDRILEVI